MWFSHHCWCFWFYILKHQLICQIFSHLELWCRDHRHLSAITCQVPSGYVKIAIENDHRNSGFAHWTWWFSMVFSMFTRPGKDDGPFRSTTLPSGHQSWQINERVLEVRSWDIFFEVFLGDFPSKPCLVTRDYPLVNIQKTMENHHF